MNSSQKYAAFVVEISHHRLKSQVLGCLSLSPQRSTVIYSISHSFTHHFSDKSAMDLESEKLCAHCLMLIPPSESPPGFNQRHHANLALLETSSQDCVLCSVFLDQWSLKTVQKRLPDVNEDTYDQIVLIVRVLETQRSDETLGWGFLSVGFFVQGHALLYENEITLTSCTSDSVFARQLKRKAPTAPIESRLAEVGSWLLECKASHPECNNRTNQLPKRLIDVGRADVPPKLVICTQLAGETARYATLSYCWGASAFTTRKSTLDAYVYELPYDELPRTHQDAIVVARCLGFQYLWIDALCIVQDDTMEWEKEASRMQNIYAGSDLTIAATDSPDGLSGCFPDTSSYGSMYAEVFATTNTASGQECIVQVHVGDLRTVASDSILNTRGWVLQEMVLSHRTLNCMHSALFWQCKTHLRTDSGLVLNCSAPSIRQSISGAPDATTTEMHRYWWTWMESYSERQFTIPDDRLPAMAGLVRHYQTASNDEPMLGLWKRSFTQDLLWMRRGTLGILEPDSRLRNMPSWSWLSCPTTINFDYWGASDAKSGKEQLQIVTDHASLADWNIQWVDEPLVSDLESSKVVIEGPVIELTFSTSPEGFGYRPPYLNINNEILDFERKKIPWRCAAQFDQFDAQDRRFPARYLCLLLRSRVYETETSFEVKEAFVILEPVDGSRDIYKRVGQGTITGDSPDTQTFDLQMRRRLELV